MKKYIFILCISSIYCIQTIFAQKSNTNNLSYIDRIALSIPDSNTKTSKGIADYISANFKTEEEKIRAIYVWITSNIEYDIENMFNVNIDEDDENKISKVLKTRKGTCNHYSLLFDDICKKIGIKSYIISGYTKLNGTIDSTPHAWCTAYIQDKWYLFDPTWGAGNVNNDKFIRMKNDNYYKVEPSMFITSHMPFDYLWQLLNYPITTQEFHEKNPHKNNSKSYFNYTDSIKAYENQSEFNRLINTASRIEKNGIKNSTTAEYLRNTQIKIKNIQIETENDRQSSIVDQFNFAINDFNEGVYGLNDFISYRNNKFTPQKKDTEIAIMIDIPLEKLNKAKSTLIELDKVNRNKTNIPIKETIKSIDEAINIAQQNRQWLDTYLKKGKLARKGMFHKVTWFGIPLN